MAKKTFNTNVAMNWISSDIDSLSENEDLKSTSAENETKKDESEFTEDKESEGSKKSVTKKEKNSGETKKKTAAFVITPERELKTRQTSILLKSSTYDKIETLAKKNNISVNSCINQILEQVLQ